MKFVISRTSEWGDFSPCEEARKETIWVTEENKAPTPEEHEKVRGRYPTWLSVGKNHRISSDGHIQRDVERTEWVVNINSVEDLLKLSDKYGELIVCRSKYPLDIVPRIEIYDTYRE